MDSPNTDSGGSERVRLAREIRQRREASGLSQPQLAARIGYVNGSGIHLPSTGYSRQYVSQAERNHNLPSRELISAIDQALRAEGVLVDIWRCAKREQESRRATLMPHAAAMVQSPDFNYKDSRRSSNGESIPSIIAFGLPKLRAALDRFDLPADKPAIDLPVLEHAVRSAVINRLESNYARLIIELPDLLENLGRARHTARTEQLSGQVDRLILQAFRAADAIAAKHGYLDLSARIIEMMRAVTLGVSDPLVSATTAYVRTEIFFANGDPETGRALLEQTAGSVDPGRSVQSAAIYGALHMRAAVASARAGRADGP